MDSVPMTRKGREKLERELDELRAKRPEIQKAVGEARERGDLSENADYHAAKEALAMLDAKINDRRSKLARATIVDLSKAPDGKVSFGARVTVRDLDDGEEEVYALVGAGEADARRNMILTTSPVGQALIGREVGDEVEVPAPSGTIRLRIEAIER